MAYNGLNAQFLTLLYGEVNLINLGETIVHKMN